VKVTKAQVLDLMERSGWTFIQAFLGVFGVVALGWLQQVLQWFLAGRADPLPPIDSVQAAAVAGASAGVAAVIALVKGYIATRFGNGTASSLPSVDEPLPPAIDEPIPGDHEDVGIPDDAEDEPDWVVEDEVVPE
jgi:hypothetical protein